MINPTSKQKTKQQHSVLNWAYANPITAGIWIFASMGLLPMAKALVGEVKPTFNNQPMMGGVDTSCTGFPFSFAIPLDEALAAGKPGHTYVLGEAHSERQDTLACLTKMTPALGEHTILLEKVPQGLKISCKVHGIPNLPGRTCQGWDSVDKKMHNKERTELVQRDTYQQLTTGYQHFGGASLSDVAFNRNLDTFIEITQQELRKCKKAAGGVITQDEALYGIDPAYFGYWVAEKKVAFLKAFQKKAMDPVTGVGFKKAFKQYESLGLVNPSAEYIIENKEFIEKEMARTNALKSSIVEHREQNPQQNLVVLAGVNHVYPRGRYYQGERIGIFLHNQATAHPFTLLTVDPNEPDASSPPENAKNKKAVSPR